MNRVEDESIQLVVTSPPYPMIEMWDEVLGRQNPSIGNKFIQNDAYCIYELMHQELDQVWTEVYRVLSPGGVACINIGDATRTIDKNFALYPNHTRIVSKFISLGFDNLPNIIWRKQTNAPNKFMGSGMLPGGAYVTLEHEWILIFRKQGKRAFKKDIEKANRQKSAYFWEERNVWFSDLWDLKGTKQKINATIGRERSAAYPFEIPYRLINMYSVYGDTILDPFLGTGTTSIAAMAASRHSIGYEIDETFKDFVFDNLSSLKISDLNNILLSRIENHKRFIAARKLDSKKKEIKHFNEYLDVEVMTSQERNMEFRYVQKIECVSDCFFVEYATAPFGKSNS
ncbi:site-specific DNA-methyltransferase [Sphingobacterium sp. SGG-5]|nr:site-specific DNA-methyltransferase [Sphingobacterium sp. SGG-5]